MITINTNTSAMVAQNNLGNIQSAMQNNMLQLSTGLRINSASDDAAGLQISNRMQTQINGLDVAKRNANDAISVAQTAEGAMQEITDIGNRMRDLVLQSENSSLSTDDKKSMQKEIDQLVKEVDRIAKTTNFGGEELLDGSASAMKFQIGSNSTESITFAIGNMHADKLGKITPAVIDAGTGAITTPAQVKATDTLAAINITGDATYKPAGSTSALAKTSTDDALDIIDGALKTVDSERAKLGAVQNRLDSTIQNLSNIQENLTTSTSRIKDVDFAKATTEMTSNQMMMQAGASILSQAKSMPQYATMLLG